MTSAMALFFSAAIVILAPFIFIEGQQSPTLYPITMTVYDTITNKPNITYSTSIPSRAVLLGAMKRAQLSSNFRFTTTDSLDYGPYLESINGLNGNTTEHTYWALLIKPKNGTVIYANVGVGCLIPNPEDNIIFKFTKW